MKISASKLEEEVEFITSRSGGPGGQNANKVETKVTVVFPLLKSKLLNERQKKTIYKSLKNRINSDGELIYYSDKYRRQLRNKEDVLLKLKSAIEKTLKPQPKRIPTKPTKSAIEKRIKEKKARSEKKKMRNKNIDPNKI